ncbi:NACHT domain-containing protein [Micromonospora sp. WMMD998]|uniref:NACHT domain-containing protein n=1 Tax=Micromonospora sp. WMMD998 TaxID=3016092 RepID=UPI00249A2AF5|nr:NACHT domain-containing protein [Micromonospora sp. WMMD998]WFE39277.1 NACHT domain-containing protein [Micromonospora sp. WMMD998]
MRSVRVRRLLAVMVIGAAVTLLARVGWAVRARDLDWGNKVAGIAGFLLLAAGTLAAILRRLMGWAQPKPLADIDLQQATENLAVALGRVWANEERLRRINDPWPLPVRWETVDGPATTGEAGGPIGAPGHSSGVFTDVAAFFTAMTTPRLVILGRAGSGKSVLAARLVRDLLAARSAGDPVPVVVPLGNWQTGATLSRWLADELVNLSPALATRVLAGDDTPVTLAQALVDAGRILPVLDGLDELSAPERAWVIEQINAYGSDRPLVMTSRPEEYRLAEHHAGRSIALATAVRLRPLSTDEVRRYLLDATAGGRTGRWQAVFDDFSATPDGAPAQVLTNPLMLWLARTVYERQHNDPTELLGFADAAAMEQHLLEALIPAVYADRPGPTRFRCRPDQARRWLVALAADLNRADSRDLAWWRMNDPNVTWVSLVEAVRSAVRMALLWGVVALVVAMDAADAGQNLFVEMGRLASAGPLGATLPSEVPKEIDILSDPSWLPEVDVGVLFEPGIFATWVVLWMILGGTLTALSRAVMSPRLPTSFEHRRLPWRLRLALAWAAAALTGLVTIGVVRTWQPQVALPKPNGFLMAAAVFGVLAAVNAPTWLVQSVDVSRAVGPAQLMRMDRRAGLIAMVGSRAVHTILIWLFAGPVMLVGYLVHATADTAGTLLFSAFGPASQRFAAVRLSYALRFRLPWRLMPFLIDAHRRGVLRQIGAVYQFRHLRLQNHLAQADADSLVQKRVEQFVTWIERRRNLPRTGGLVMQPLPWSRQRWRDPVLAARLAARPSAPGAHIAEPLDGWLTDWTVAQTWQLGSWRRLADDSATLPGEQVKLHLRLHPVALLVRTAAPCAAIGLFILPCLSLLIASRILLAGVLLMAVVLPVFLSFHDHVTVTDRRMLVVALSDRVEVPLQRIVDLRYAPSPLGQFFGYGQIEVITADTARVGATVRRAKRRSVGWHDVTATAEGTVVAHLRGVRDPSRTCELIRHLLKPGNASPAPQDVHDGPAAAPPTSPTPT